MNGDGMVARLMSLAGNANGCTMVSRSVPDDSSEPKSMTCYMSGMPSDVENPLVGNLAVDLI